MIIRPKRITTDGKTGTVYSLCNDVSETLAEAPEEIACFNSLELTVLVARYMRGDPVNETEAYRAREALRKAGKA